LELRDRPIVDAELLGRDGAAKPALLHTDAKRGALDEVGDLPRRCPSGRALGRERERSRNAIRMREGRRSGVPRILTVVTETNRNLRLQDRKARCLQESFELRLHLDGTTAFVAANREQLALVRRQCRPTMLLDVVRRVVRDGARVIERVLVLNLQSGVL